MQAQREVASQKTEAVLNKVPSKTKLSKNEQLEQAERIRQKNEELLLKKQEMIQAREQKKKERQDKLELLIQKAAPSIQVERDPNRLTDETNLQRARRIQLEEERKLQAQYSGRDSGRNFSAPRFGDVRQTYDSLIFECLYSAVPTWRQGL